MRRRLCSALSAAAAVATLGLSGCSPSESRTSTSHSSTPPAGSSPSAASPTVDLPSPDALTDVLNRLADPNVPGINKVNLIEGATPERAVTLDNFINALRDNGYLPIAFAANNIAWSDKNPSNAAATVTVNTARGNSGAFMFPMEFAPFQGGWQLSRQTADMLLALSNSPAPTSPASSPPASPAPPPPPGPTPAPEPAPTSTPPG
jgi:hypothetical protein